MSTPINLERLKKPFIFARHAFGDIDVSDDAALQRVQVPLKAKLGLTARVPITFKNAVVRRLHEETEDFRDKHPDVEYREAVKRVGARKPWLLYFAVLDNCDDNDRALDVQIEYTDAEGAQ